ncbi:hypothetical protein B0H15DRAFT_777429 [Mycena belliarum]|uniref:Uncharacterized protein n=1 Tax=Mycena belliarum TaxID=1033014 RepID=A0AAD6XP14_9AGAR|nr:hypothetical protein B0H15DRAFT_777429 [Mycena belliae]
MAAKALSTSTLSLKFMQNAHRAKNLAEVQLEKAEVKDDGEWEVAKEIRDAWGPETTHSVSYEASYLPFLFSDDAPTPAAKGRRAFKRGMEVADGVRASLAPVAPPAASTSKPAGRPKSISSTLSGRQPPKSANAKNGPRGKTARQAIYDNAGVGEDLRHNKNRSEPASLPTSAPPPSLPNAFLKPAGIDEPAPVKPSMPAAAAPAAEPPEQKAKGKRARDQMVETPEGESGKKKKKKKKGDQTE